MCFSYLDLVCVGGAGDQIEAIDDLEQHKFAWVICACVPEHISRTIMTFGRKKPEENRKNGPRISHLHHVG